MLNISLVKQYLLANILPHSLYWLSISIFKDKFSRKLRKTVKKIWKLQFMSYWFDWLLSCFCFLFLWTVQFEIFSQIIIQWFFWSEVHCTLYQQDSTLFFLLRIGTVRLIQVLTLFLVIPWCLILEREVSSRRCSLFYKICSGIVWLGNVRVYESLFGTLEPVWWIKVRYCRAACH